MLTDGVDPAGFALSLGRTMSGTLRAGQVFQTTVQGSRGQLSLQLGGTRVPLGENAALLPGQAVRVQVLPTGQGIQLHIVPQPSPTEAAASGMPVQSLVVPVLESLGALEAAEAASQLLPTHMPRTAAAIQRLLTLFVHRGSMGADLQQLAALVAQAGAAGALVQELTGPFAALAAQFSAAESQELKHLLAQLSGARSTEARLAIALKAGTLDETLAALYADLRAQVAGLRGNQALLTYLRGSGQLRQFEEAAQRILERLSGGQLQNLHGLDRPYVYLEIPFPPGAPIRHAQIHILSEGGRGASRFSRENMAVALDLSTTRLGDLWVTLRLVRGCCACHIRATALSIVEAIQEAGGELMAGLAAAGYPESQVRVSLWDGDRLGETARLLRMFSGLDVTA